MRILRHYVIATPPLDDKECKLLISKVASEKGVTPSALQQAVKRYIEDGWKQGFSLEWKKYTGWSADTPPDMNTAVQLLCESFFDFVKNYGPLIQENRAYYLRNAIEDRDKNLKDILSSENDMIVSTHFYMTLTNKDEPDACMCYLTYRVQLDLYEMLKESGQFDGLSWLEFVWDVRHRKRIRDAAIIVAQETLKDFQNKGHFNFGVKDVKLLLKCGINTSL